jgi:hypothetical protein
MIRAIAIYTFARSRLAQHVAASGKDRGVLARAAPLL